MNCETCRELIEPGHSAPVGAGQEAELAEHLQACPECAQAKAELDALAKWYALIEDETPPEEFSQKWRAALKREQGLPRPLRYRITAGVFAAASIIGIVLMARQVLTEAANRASAPQLPRFHVAGADMGEINDDITAAGGAMPEMAAQEPQALADAAPAPAAPASQPEQPAAAAAPKALMEEGAAEALFSDTVRYRVEVNAKAYKALSAFIETLKKRDPEAASSYAESVDADGRVISFEMSFTNSELNDFDLCLSLNNAVKSETGQRPEGDERVFVKVELAPVS